MYLLIALLLASVYILFIMAMAIGTVAPELEIFTKEKNKENTRGRRGGGQFDQLYSMLKRI